MDKCTKIINDKNIELEKLNNLKKRNQNLIHNLKNENLDYDKKIGKTKEKIQNLKKEKNLLENSKDTLKKLKKDLLIWMIFPSVLLLISALPMIITSPSVFNQTLIKTVYIVTDSIITLFSTIPSIIEIKKYKKRLNDNEVDNIKKYIIKNEEKIQIINNAKTKNNTKINTLETKQYEIEVAIKKIKEEISKFKDIKINEIDKYLNEKSEKELPLENSLNKKYIKK